MSNIQLENVQDLVEKWLKQEREGNQFPVPFDLAWEIAGYSNKGNGKRKLTEEKSPLKEGEDYAIEKGEIQLNQSKPSGRSRDSIYLSISGFVGFLVMSNTKHSRQLVLDIISTLSGMAMGTIDFTQSSSTKCGFVYLVKQSINGYCKIGKSKTPYKRKETLQTGSPLELVIVHRIFSFDCSQLEKSLHKYYFAYWIRGEWFELSDELIGDFVRVATELDQQQEVAQLAGGAE